MRDAGLRLVLVIVVLGAVLIAQAGLVVEREFAAPGGVCRSLAWSRDGRWIAAGGECGEVLLLAAATGRVVHVLEHGARPIERLCFAPDGRTLAVVGGDLCVWDVARGEPGCRFGCSIPASPSWSADGQRFAFLCGPGRVAVRSSDGVELANVRTGATDLLLHAVLSPDGARVAVVTSGGRVVEVDVASGVVRERCRMPDGVQALAWLDDGRLLLQGGRLLHGLGDEPLEVVPLATGLDADPSGRLAVVWNGTVVRGCPAFGAGFTLPCGGPAAVGPDGQSWVREHAGALLFQVGADEVRRVPLSLRGRIDEVALTGDGRHAVIATRGDLYAIELATGKASALPQVARGCPVPYSLGAEFLLWSPPSDDPDIGELTWWSVEALRAGRVAPVRTVRLRGIAACRSPWPQVHSEGRWAAVGDRVYDLLGDGVAAWQLPDLPKGRAMPVADGGRAVVLHSPLQGPKLSWLEVVRADGERLARTDDREPVHLADVSPDGRSVLVVSDRQMAVLETDGLTEVVCEHAVFWPLAGWLDGETLLVVSGRPPMLQMRSVSAPLAELELPEQPRRLVIDRAHQRALVVAGSRLLAIRIRR